jgi:NAD(P)-dependent dehydrogenase (short-subunit alcohol dehydrogenase family)
MSHYLVFGASRGLGLTIASKILDSGHKISTVSRTKNQQVNTASHIQRCLDLADFTDNQLEDLFRNIPPVDGICFAQRYRPNAFPSSLDEYNISVRSIARILEYVNTNSSVVAPDGSCRAVLIGSTYSSSCGYDQNWSYHAAKHALIGIMRYFSIVRNRHLLVFMVSPPTFMKEGSYSYWATTEKYELWKSSPTRSLPTASSISEVCLQLLYDGSPLLCGINLALDGGMANIYPDQIKLASNRA